LLNFSSFSAYSCNTRNSRCLRRYCSIKKWTI